MAHEDVLGHGQVGEQAGMLMHDRNAAVQRVEGRPQRDRDTVEHDLTGIGPMHAGQHLHASALAGAVLAEQRQDLARPHLEGDVADGEHAAERLRDVIETSRHNLQTQCLISSQPRRLG